MYKLLQIVRQRGANEIKTQVSNRLRRRVSAAGCAMAVQAVYKFILPAVKARGARTSAEDLAALAVLT